MSFLVVMTGRNCGPWAHRAVRSVLDQVDFDLRVAVVCDAPTDGTVAEVDRAFDGSDIPRYVGVHRRRIGAMGSQVEAWRALDPDPGDVVVWVDLDDRLAHDGALARVAVEYDVGALLTYGQYRPDPASDTCVLTQPYPRRVLEARAVRQWCRDGRGILHNHLRTVSWDVLGRIPERCFRNRAGQWWDTGPDMAVMLPAFELAGPQAVFIPDVLYVYTSDCGHAEWRAVPDRVRRNHWEMFHMKPVCRVEVLPSRQDERREARKARQREYRLKAGRR